MKRSFTPASRAFGLRALSAAPLMLAALFVAWLAMHQSEVRESLYSHADFVSTPVIAELIHGAPPHSTVTLGQYPWYEALWLLTGTKWVPHHWFVWQLIPFGLWLLTALLAYGIVARTTGRLAGATTASLILCGGLVVRLTAWTLNNHGPIAPHVALLGFALVAALAYPRRARGPIGVVAAILLGLVSGVGATDPLLVPVGFAPLLAVGLAVWVRHRLAWPFVLAVLAAVVAVVFKSIIVGAAEDHLITWTLRPVLFAGADNFFRAVGYLFGAVVALFTSSPFNAKVELRSTVALAGGLVGVGASILVVRFGARQLVASWRGSTDGNTDPDLSADADRVAEAAASEGAPATTAVTREVIWFAVVGFWVLVIVANAASYVFTDVAVSEFTGRYLLAGWVGVCVLVPMLAARMEYRAVGSLVATVLCAASLYGFVDAPGPNDGRNFPGNDISSVIRFSAQRHGVVRGYGSFWDSMAITWHTRFRLKLFPISGCENDEVHNCRFYQHTISSWYAPQAGPSMLVVDGNQPLQPHVDPKYGTPTAIESLGSFKVYFYDHDISPAIGPF